MIVALFATLMLRLDSVPTAFSCTSADRDDNSAIRGGIAPAAAIAI